MSAESSNNSSNLKKIIVQKNPSESQLSQLGIKSWPKRWGCCPGKYHLKYEEGEMCYIVRGKVKVYPKNDETVEFGAGDLVIIPKGITCIWDVSIAVDKHYKFDAASSSTAPPPSS
ncbi:hypothetical protein OROMI_016008 [Orobanche minor]